MSADERPRRLVLLSMSVSLADDAAAFESFVDRVFDVRLAADVAGTVSDYPSDKREIIQIGYPAGSDDPYFQPARVRPGRRNIAEVPLGRLVFARRVTDVVCAEDALRALVARALTGHDVRVWFGESPVAPERVDDARAPRANREAIMAAVRASLGVGVS